jgi:hypothetical protein
MISWIQYYNVLFQKYRLSAFCGHKKEQEEKNENNFLKRLKKKRGSFCRSIFFAFCVLLSAFLPLPTSKLVSQISRLLSQTVNHSIQLQRAG